MITKTILIGSQDLLLPIYVSRINKIQYMNEEGIQVLLNLFLHKITESCGNYANKFKKLRILMIFVV